jgi:NADPH:quinone reductase-like Zn-dependent oxidoreductase
MRAACALGPAGPVVSQEVPLPSPAPGEALVAVHAVALTAGELAWPQSWPAIPGHEISGTVAGLGESVTSLAAGQQVYGLVGFDRDGGAAEYVTLPADTLAAKPASVDHLGAASMALAALTAWQALVDRAHVVPGQHVLVTGGAGGVGSYAVQLAAALGARVTATASACDAAFVAGLGADRVIDYAAPTLRDQVGKVDVAIDTAGAQALAQTWDVIRPGGIIVGVAADPAQAAPSPPGAQAPPARSAYFVVEPNADALATLARLADTGRLRACVGQVFPLADAAAALDALQRQHIRGKTVLSVRPEPGWAANSRPAPMPSA